jgi:hypothetical protein
MYTTLCDWLFATIWAFSNIHHYLNYYFTSSIETISSSKIIVTATCLRRILKVVKRRGSNSNSLLSFSDVIQDIWIVR